jgi:hypothetical protein
MKWKTDALLRPGFRWQRVQSSPLLCRISPFFFFFRFFFFFFLFFFIIVKKVKVGGGYVNFSQ